MSNETNPHLLVGQRLITNIEDEDTDDQGERRLIPIGTHGTIDALDYISPDGVAFYDIDWDNGGWTVWSAIEIAADATLINKG